jgi:hypothetical protein
VLTSAVTSYSTSDCELSANQYSSVGIESQLLGLVENGSVPLGVMPQVAVSWSWRVEDAGSEEWESGASVTLAFEHLDAVDGAFDGS